MNRLGKITIILLVICLMLSIYTIKENEYGYVTRFSKFVKMGDKSGIGFKIPMIDMVTKISKAMQVYEISQSEVITGDKKTLVVDSFATWKIEDPYKLMKSVGSIREIENRIDATAYSVIKNTLGKMEQNEIINSNDDSRDAVNTTITEEVNKQIRDYGIIVVSVEIKKLDLPVDNQQAVYNRMISERNQMAAKYTAQGDLEASKIINEANKEIQIITSKANAQAEELRGQGESEYMKILSEAYATPDRENYFKFVKSLEALEGSLKGNKTLILSNDSFIVKVLNGLQ